MTSSTVTIRSATLADIPFIVETIVSAEKSNSPRMGLATLFAQSEERTRELIAILVERGEIVKNDDLIRYGRNEKSSENYAIVA